MLQNAYLGAKIGFDGEENEAIGVTFGIGSFNLAADRRRVVNGSLHLCVPLLDLGLVHTGPALDVLLVERVTPDNFLNT